MKTAKAAVFMGPGKPFEVRDFDITEPPAGYGRSSLVASGVCGTDIHMTHGTLTVGAPSIIGHEFVGRLEACDDREAAACGLKAGDFVVADIAVPCGECLLCKTGDDANCVNMQVTNGGSIDEAPYLYGGYAQVNFTPLKNLIRIYRAVKTADCLFGNIILGASREKNNYFITISNTGRNTCYTLHAILLITLTGLFV